MSIYDKALAALTTSDLQQLLDGKAVENIRLEFKRDDPSKDETLKKLSSFANTYGGEEPSASSAGTTFSKGQKSDTKIFGRAPVNWARARAS